MQYKDNFKIADIKELATELYDLFEMLDRYGHVTYPTVEQSIVDKHKTQLNELLIQIRDLSEDMGDYIEESYSY